MEKKIKVVTILNKNQNNYKTFLKMKKNAKNNWPF